MNNQIKKILFGKIQVRVLKDLIVVDNAVWTENDTIYKARDRKFKGPAFIHKILESKVVGTVNKKKF
jgi:hypothetical protein